MANKNIDADGIGNRATIDDAAALPSSQPINQEINISNYMDYAQSLSYADSGLQSIGLTPLTVNGQVEQTYDTKTGVQAEAFVTTGTGPQYVVVGYAGTGFDIQGTTVTTSFYSSSSSMTGGAGDLFTGAQFHDEVAILAGHTPQGAAASATAFAQQVVSDASQLGIGKSQIYLTGHNLGGTLAEYAASKTGLAGTTFGAAGIVTDGSTKASNFSNIVFGGDPLGNYASDGPNTLGPLLLSSDIKHYGKVDVIGPTHYQQQLASEVAHVASKHSLSAVEKFLSQSINNSPQAYASILGGSVNLSDFGSFAAPTGAQSSDAPTPGQGTTPPVAYPTISAATAPSEEVVNQDINIDNYLYSARTVPFRKSGLSELGLKPIKVNGKFVQVYDQKVGVSAEAFETTGAGSPRIIIAYEGTHPYGRGESNTFTGGQLLDDASIFAGKPAPGAAAAVKFADRVLGIAERRGIPQSDVSLTGHSLGAAESEYAAEATGLGGVTFGTPGIDIRGPLPPSLLTNFVDNGDPVGNYATDGADPLGNFVTSPQIMHYGGETLIGTSTQAQQAQADLATTSANFFDPKSSLYKNFGAASKSIIADFANHHLSTYVTDLDDTGYAGVSLVCYCTGTKIRTPGGDCAVEALRTGDLVVTASGSVRPIKWLGHRTIDCRRHPRPHEVNPVRIAAHAFGENRPIRDLFVSLGHAICVDVLGEVLIPASALVNGSTIRQIEVDEVTYWHVELESHDVILAEDLPAESYLDMGNRGFFQEAAVVDLAFCPDGDASQRTHADFCRPFHGDGPLVEVVRAQLHKRAEASGLALTSDLDVHLVVDGERLDPVVRDRTARFHVPVGSKNVWLVSPTARPCDTMGSGDTRDLGVNVAALRIDDGFGVRDIAIDDPLLCIGFHTVEDGTRRWTSGRARLPTMLWEGCEDGFYLLVDFAGPPVPRWTAPAMEDTSAAHDRRLLHGMNSNAARS